MQPYNKHLKQFARDLRKDSTKSEVIFWCSVRNRSLGGFRFLRQKPIGPFIADFYCAQAKLVVELDGYSHQSAEAFERDQAKDIYLSSLGLHVLRFSDQEVYSDLLNVLREVLASAQTRSGAAVDLSSL